MEETKQEPSAERRRQYDVPFTLQKEFSPAELTQYARAFSSQDPFFRGTVPRDALKSILISLGFRDEADRERLTGYCQADSPSYEDFLKIFLAEKTSGATREEVQVSGKTMQHVTREGAAGYHSYPVEERQAFVRHINISLGHDPDLAYMMPINPDNDDLFKSCVSGALLCKLINVAVPGTIFEKAINVKQQLNIYQTRENLNLAINTAKSIGCTIVSIFPESIIEQKEHLVLGLIWQIVKIQILRRVDLKHSPELVKLLEEGEDLNNLLKLPPEQLLMRWFNYHLKAGGSTRRVTNFSADVKDSECYTVLLHQIDPSRCSLAALQETDLSIRAHHVIQSAQSLGVETVTQASDILSGSAHLNILLVASIFNTNHGLTVSEGELVELVSILEDDVEGTREERAFRMWINSLEIENLHITNLYEDVKDGLCFLQVIEKLVPGTVDQRRVEKKINHKVKKITNNNYAVDLGKQLGFSLVGVGGSDFVDGNKKLILAYTWQLVRFAILRLVGGKRDTELIEWANSRVPDMHISNFGDGTLKTGVFVVKLYASIEPRTVNWEIVTPGATPEEAETNAKYALSLARKLGAVVFCTWEDIVEAKPRMILTLVAAAHSLARTYSRAVEGEAAS
jgi:plastin-1